MSTIEHIIGDGTTTLTVDAAPTVAAPPPEARLFTGPIAYGPSDGATPYIVVEGGLAITLQLWMFDATMNAWFKVQSALGISAGMTMSLSPCPRGATYFLQVVSNLGVKQVGLGFLGDG